MCAAHTMIIPFPRGKNSGNLQKQTQSATPFPSGDSFYNIVHTLPLGYEMLSFLIHHPALIHVFHT